MERTKRRGSLLYIVLIAVAFGLLGLLTEGCRGEKCGCKADLNSVYKPRKHRW